MKSKFKKGQEVYWSDYQAKFIILKSCRNENGEVFYQLSIKAPIPNNIKWLPLFLKVKFAFENELILTPNQQTILIEKQRRTKLSRLLGK